MAVTSDFGSEGIGSGLVWATKCLLSSMEEHGSSKPLVGGSSPSGDTNVGLGEVVRPSPFQGGDYGFKPYHPSFIGISSNG